MCNTVFFIVKAKTLDLDFTATNSDSFSEQYNENQ